MKKLEKGVIGLILAIIAGTAVTAVSSSGQQAENSSEAFDKSEYRKAVKSTNYHKKSALKIELSSKKDKVTGIMPKSPASLSLLKQWKMDSDLDFQPGKQAGLLISKQKVSLPTANGQELVHATTGEIGYDPQRKRILVFAKDRDYSNGFYPLGHLKRNDPNPSNLSTDQDMLEFSFKD
ncbi:hypothetical protein lacNasYZ03_01600 [Lactobacillus nasalidis]|uniref:Cyclophilin-like domain-containing protein n=1 Tax=Lactobacillus nasalidis TaxID=2797258 RepID=A0ABQ3W2G3_9LACO|nr:cyclophilin-like fold protein [Lactobacillus nasalidis]GHV97237.1 hypothetical protein lacNasYZ01_04190 [Lactobacillus nasalidis]GHW00197.1 hypothetical protein lacNasYZ02_16260 [Lactobacillus nasalidis]GHW00473.1 hypothetical protein lacNasYZ03_01600 [Lactobacillus nasalidis]